MPKTDSYRTALDLLVAHLRTTTDFSSAFDRFERGLASDHRFIEACEPAKSELLERSLDHLTRQLIGGRASWSWLAPLLRYAPGRFLHGAALVGHRPAMLFYFEEHELGLVCIAGRECIFTRLSALPLPRGVTLARDRGTA